MGLFRRRDRTASRTRTVSFLPTQWSRVLFAKAGSRDAWNHLVERYQPAVLSYLRKKGWNRTDAEDIAQETFLRMFDRNLLDRVDPAKGRFRDLLRAITRRTAKDFLRAQRARKRGGGRVILSLWEDLGDRLSSSLRALTGNREADRDFDKAWIESLVRLGMENLKAHCQSLGVPYSQALELYSQGDNSYQEIAGQLGVKATDVGNYIHRGRLMLMGYMKEAVRDYCASETEYREELAFLKRRFSKMRH